MKLEDVKISIAFYVVAAAIHFELGFSNAYVSVAAGLITNFANESYLNRNVSYDLPTLGIMYEFFANSYFVGFGIGMFFGPFFSNRLGRRLTLIFMNSLVVLVSCSRFIAALVHCPELLLVGRFLASILTGVLFPTLITFLQESAPTRIRGALSAASEIMFSLMGLIGFAISLPSILGSDVRLLFGIPIIVAVIAVLILIPLHETPKFLLIERNDRDAAIKSIKFYHGKHANVEQVLQNIEIEAKEEEEKSSYIEILKTPYLRKAVLIGVVLLQVVVPAWGMFVKGTVFSQKAGFSEIEAGNVQTIAGFTFFLGTWMCAFTVEKLGRRPLVLTFTIGTTIPVILFMIFGLLQANVSWFKYLCAVCLTSYLFLYGGIGTIAWFFMTELVPQHHRTYVQAICNFVHIYIVFGLMFALDALLKAISLWAFIPLYIVPNIFCFIFLYFNMPETKNKEIYEIVRKLRGDQKNIDY